MSSVNVIGLNKIFDVDDRKNVVLKDLSISFSAGRFTTIVGPNGCGKTTLLNSIAGLVQPDSGSVSIETESGAPPTIGYVWQDYRASLLPWMNVVDNIALPLRIRGMDRSERRAVGRDLLKSFSSEIKSSDRVYNLSGGQQQLVCLLRSFVARPDVLLLDEPLSALDQFTRWTMAFRIEEFWMKKPIPAIFISHDVDEAVMLADEIILMSRDCGRVHGIVENVLPHPRNKRMLTAPEHIRCREQVIDFLFHQDAIRDDAPSNHANTPRI